MLKPKGVSVYKPSVWFAVIYVIWKKKSTLFYNFVQSVVIIFFWPVSRNFLKLLPENCTMLPTRSKDISTVFANFMNHNTNNTRFINWDTFTLFGETKLEVLLLSGRPLHGKPRTLRYLVMISQELLLTFKRLGKDFYFPKFSR